MTRHGKSTLGCEEGCGGEEGVASRWWSIGGSEGSASLAVNQIHHLNI
jgi:hypothetical protein